MNADPPAPVLLSLVELGGYPDFRPLYREKGYTVITEHSVRRAISAMRRAEPRVVVAEFNFQSDFRDRTSSLDTLLSVTQRFDRTRVIVFYEREFAHQLEKLTARFPIFATLPFPIDRAGLARCLDRIAVEAWPG